MVGWLAGWLARSPALVLKIILSWSTKLGPGVYDAAIKRTTNCFSATTRPAAKFGGETRVVHHGHYVIPRAFLMKSPPALYPFIRMRARFPLSFTLTPIFAFTCTEPSKFISTSFRARARVRIREEVTPTMSSRARVPTSKTTKFIIRDPCLQASNPPVIYRVARERETLTISSGWSMYYATMRVLFVLGVWQWGGAWRVNYQKYLKLYAARDGTRENELSSLRILYTDNSASSYTLYVFYIYSFSISRRSLLLLFPFLFHDRNVHV